MNDENIERVNAWFKHLKLGIVLCLAGHIITWSWLIILTMEKN